MTQKDKAVRFTELHREVDPILLYNAWDSGSAKAIAAAGASAIATSSWAVAAAQGYGDGEALPFDFLERVAGRIGATVDLPMTVDFEGGYSENDDAMADNLARLIDAGAIGINFEDRVVRGRGLHPIERQAERIAILRDVADRKAIPLFINARTDLFLGQEGDPARSVDEAIERAGRYAAAGASGFFIPGLIDGALIARICEGSPLPVNVMMMSGAPSVDALAKIGVARISYGADPYAEAMQRLQAAAAAIFS